MTDLESVLDNVSDTLAVLQARKDIPPDVRIDDGGSVHAIEESGLLYRVRLRMAGGVHVLQIDGALVDDYIESVEHPEGKPREYLERIRRKWEEQIERFCR
jgi:hypothetical protein